MEEFRLSPRARTSINVAEITAMQNDDDQPKFLNRRSWQSYLSALQSVATYPKVMEAVQSGRAWFTQNLDRASSWSAGSVKLNSGIG
jgi:hypothetical protein